MLRRLAKLSPSSKGLDIPADIARLDVKIGRQEHYPPSLLAAQQLHESHFDPGAVSSANAGGISQFIPGTAAEYDVKYGTSKPAVKSQIRGQARYMKDLGAPKSAAEALGGYLGDHNPNSSYAQGIIADQAKYKQLDKPTMNRKQRAKYSHAREVLHRTGAPRGPAAAKQPGGHPFKKAASKVRNTSAIKEHLKWAPGEELNAGINPIVKAWAKKYGATLNAGYDPGGGHVSPGHNVTGTATDMVPTSNTPAGWDRLEQGLKVLTNDGFEVLYGSNGIGHAYPNHGRGNHAHIEWANVGNGWSSGSSSALQRLGHLSDAQISKIEHTVGPGGSAGSIPSSVSSAYAAATGTSPAKAAAALKAMGPRQRLAAVKKLLGRAEDALGAGRAPAANHGSTAPTPSGRYKAPSRSARVGLH